MTDEQQNDNNNKIGRIAMVFFAIFFGLYILNVLIGKAKIVFGMGYYLIDKINPLGRIYNRIGYRYFFKDNLFGLFNIRASFGKADFFEFGIGYKFGK